MPDSARRYTQITKAVYERPWAIQPATLAVIEEVVRLRASGAPLTEEQIEHRVAAASNGPRSGGQRSQGVAVIPIYGVISQRMNLMTEMSGGTTVEGITRSFREALADPEIGAIVFDIDSPGGAVDGVAELAAEIRAARGVKPMTAVSNTLMASAAYWLGSQADEVIASPSSVVGSIGVIAMHVDQSKADEQAGEAYTFITAGEGKADGNEHEPLSDSARASLQSMADDYYALFTADVAAARGVTAKRISGEWKADTFTAAKAKAAGLVDRVDTLDGTVRRALAKANAGRARMTADAGDVWQLGAKDTIPALLATMPIQEQAALWASERDRIAALIDEKARLRAKEGRSLSAPMQEQLDALAPLPEEGGTDEDADTVEPESATPPTAPEATPRPYDFDSIEAVVRGGYPVPAIEVHPS